MIIGMKWKGDGDSWWDVQWRCRVKTQCKNIVELCVHGDACWWNRNNCGCFFILCHEWMYKQKGKKHTWCLVFSFSVCFLLFSLLDILSRSLFFFTKMICVLFSFSSSFNYYISFSSFPIILIDIFFKTSVVQFKEVTTLSLIHIYYF